MTRYLTLAALALSLGACTLTPSQTASVDKALASPAGQLFCSIQLNGGGSVLVGVIDAAATASAPGAAPVAVLATNMGKAFVDSACTQAAQSVTASTGVGIAVSPPAAGSNVANIAINVPVKLPTSAS